MTKIEEISKKILSQNYDKDDLTYLLSLKDEKEKSELFAIADKVCKFVYSDSVFVRGIIEFSNYCIKNCNYCGIRRENKKSERYRMEPETIIKLALEAEKYGYATIVLQSGEEKYYDDSFELIIKEIKKNSNIAITLSVGEKSEELLKKWYDAGANRFLLRIETTDKRLFEKLHPDSNFEDRKNVLFKIKEIGYETGTGIMVGLPEQTIESIANDILFFKQLEANMIGIGPFLPHSSTPMGNCLPEDFDLVLKTLSVIRLVLPCSNIPATTAMGTINPLGRQKALKSGANVLMPNFTPQKYRPNYTLYDNKICIYEGSDDCRSCVDGIAAFAGKKIVRGVGTNIQKNIVVEEIFGI